MIIDKELEESLLKAVDLLKKDSGVPESIWHPDFGWVLFQNKPTETSEAFYEYLINEENKKPALER